MLTTVGADQFLNVLRATTLTAYTGYVALVQSISDWRAGTFVEANYTGYLPAARKAITFGAPAATAPVGGREIANSAIITGDLNTGTLQSMIGWALMSASTGGVAHWIGLFDSDLPFFGVGDPTAEDIYAAAHGLQTDQRVFVLDAPGAVIPPGLAINTAYFVLAVGLTADNFRLAATSGGAAINITARGAALFIPYKAVDVATNSTPEFAVGALKLQLQT